MSPLSSPIKILVVDDSKTIRRTAEVLFKKEGFNVETAADGFEALPLVMRIKPDIMFIDVMMPRLNGYQTCALIKGNPQFKHIPIVMLSSKDGLFDKAKGRIVGANSYVTKPFTREDMVRAINHVFPST